MKAENTRLKVELKARESQVKSLSRELLGNLPCGLDLCSFLYSLMPLAEDRGDKDKEGDQDDQSSGRDLKAQKIVQLCKKVSSPRHKAQQHLSNIVQSKRLVVALEREKALSASLGAQVKQLRDLSMEAPRRDPAQMTKSVEVKTPPAATGTKAQQEKISFV